MILYVRQTLPQGWQKWPVFASGPFSAVAIALWHLLRGREVEIYR